MTTPEAAPPLLELAGATRHYVIGNSLFDRITGQRRRLTALDQVDLVIRQGEVLGLVGESGCGKSTLAQIALRLVDLSAGTLRYRGEDVGTRRGAALRPFRRRVQIVFQDPNSSLNPRKTVARCLGEALKLLGMPPGRRLDRSRELLELVGLGDFALPRYPHQLSGGQRQRVAMARALAMEPELLVADEPVSSLDVSLQAQIINLLMKLREQLGLTILFISHDLALVNHISTRVAVMYAGRIVEMGPPSIVLGAPAHPYSRLLLSAVPRGIAGRNRAREAEAGMAPTPGASSIGCHFATRCPQVMAICREQNPRPVAIDADHIAECHLQGGARSQGSIDDAIGHQPALDDRSASGA
jgi:oligopeptide/dipeptide ABC transporter ATP-binding protein